VPEWVPREENELADYYSKVVDVDDWQINPRLFQSLDEAWGPHTLDGFASLITKKVDRYCSRWWNPGCFGVDVFTVPWEGENLWLAPPLYLIARVLRTLSFYECHGSLVVPKWVSASWWPSLWSGYSWQPWVKAVVELPLKEDTFLSGSCPWNLFGGTVPKCQVLVLRLCTYKHCARC